MAAADDELVTRHRDANFYVKRFSRATCLTLRTYDGYIASRHTIIITIEVGCFAANLLFDSFIQGKIW